MKNGNIKARKDQMQRSVEQDFIILNGNQTRNLRQTNIPVECVLRFNKPYSSINKLVFYHL